MSVKCTNCASDIWEVSDGIAECTNCGSERPFHSRKSHVGNPSQLAKIEEIKAHFTNEYQESNRGGLARWDVTFQPETGYAYVSVDTSSNPYLNSGGSFRVGPRGRVECFSVHGICKGKEFWKKAWERRFR